jgi:hypothetical protein
MDGVAFAYVYIDVLVVGMLMGNLSEELVGNIFVLLNAILLGCAYTNY